MFRADVSGSPVAKASPREFLAEVEMDCIARFLLVLPPCPMKVCTASASKSAFCSSFAALAPLIQSPNCLACVMSKHCRRSCPCERCFHFSFDQMGVKDERLFEDERVKGRF